MSGSPSSAVLPHTGDVIDGKYQLERLIGQGGMGAVYAARHLKLGNACAIKLMLADASNPEASARFVNEGRAAAHIQNEHVVRVSDVDEEHGYAYMVLELLEGEDLAQVLDRSGALEPHVAVGYVLQALKGVEDAHALGIVHRDLKPSNLFLTKRRDGSALVKVLDFGISKAGHAQGVLAQAPAARTSTKAMLGSPLYMSPEQLRSSKSVDARADIWAIGVILFELLTNSLPFGGENLGELFAAILELDPPLARSKRPEIPAGLEQIVVKCLQRRPEHRYPSAIELARDLAPFATPASASPLAASSFVQPSASAALPFGTALLAPHANPAAAASSTGPFNPNPIHPMHPLGTAASGSHGPSQAPAFTGAITGSDAHVLVRGTGPGRALTPHTQGQTYPGAQTGSTSRSGTIAVIVVSALFFIVGASGIGVYVSRRPKVVEPPTSASGGPAAEDLPSASTQPSAPPLLPVSVASASPPPPDSASASPTALAAPPARTPGGGTSHTTTGGHKADPPKTDPPKTDPPKADPPKADPPKPTTTSVQQNSR
jgi:eukaryotic-like serine/threonine-protein kinase